MCLPLCAYLSVLFTFRLCLTDSLQTPKLLISKKRNPIILLIHWLVHAYGIIALTRLQNPVIYGTMIACIPFPAIFYIGTARFADPTHLQ